MIIIKEFYNSLPDLENEKLTKIHNQIFKSNDNLNEKISKKNKSIILIAYKENEIIGYKIGYEINSSKFYSWLGGVKKEHRKHGIAQKLINKQIEILKPKGYKIIQTKTFNKWKSMLILNIKNDFEITNCYTQNNDIAIILEKNIE